MAAITINVSGPGMIPSATQNVADFDGILSASTVYRFRTPNLPSSSSDAPSLGPAATV